VQKESPIDHPKELVKLYRAFYRARYKNYSLSSNAILKPIDEAASVILKAEHSWTGGNALINVVAGKLCKLMQRVDSSNAEGYAVFRRNEKDKETSAVLAFSEYIVQQVFEGAFKGDRARLAGRQLNLIRDTCEFLYRLEEDKERHRKKEQGMKDATTEDSDQGS